MNKETLSSLYGVMSPYNNTIFYVYTDMYNYQTSGKGMIQSAIKDVTVLQYLEEYTESLDYEEFYNQSTRKIREIFTTSQEWLEMSIQRILIAHHYQIKTWIDTLNLQYNPIENYNMIETEKTDNTNQDSGNDKLEINTTTNLTMLRGEQSVTSQDNIGEQSGSRTTNGQVAPFNASYSDSEKGVENYNDSSYSNSSNSNRLSYEDTDSTKVEDTHTTTYGKNNTFNGSRTLTRTGNIGVTTSQQMLESERKIAEFDIIRKIVELINRDLCEGVWVIL